MLAILFGSVTIFLAANMPCQVSSSLITWPKRQLPVNRALVWSLEEFISTRTFTWSERFRLYPTCVDFWRINGCGNFRNLVNDPLDCATWTWYTNLYSSCNVQAIRYVWIHFVKQRGCWKYLWEIIFNVVDSEFIAAKRLANIYIACLSMLKLVLPTNSCDPGKTWSWTAVLCRW